MLRIHSLTGSGLKWDMGKWLALMISTCLIGPDIVQGQLLADTLFSWQGYSRTGICRLRIYTAPAQDETDRKYAVILQELAENHGPSTASDVRYLAERIGRTYGMDPSAAYWVLHWGGFSFEGAEPDRDRELFLRATFRRTGSGSLGSPSWRLLTREEVEKLTDRQFR